MASLNSLKNDVSNFLHDFDRSAELDIHSRSANFYSTLYDLYNKNCKLRSKHVAI